jgi:hypothetical protein
MKDGEDVSEDENVSTVTVITLHNDRNGEYLDEIRIHGAWL